MNQRTIYALYKGDEFIDVGTARELADKRNISIRTIQDMAAPSKHKIDKGNRLLAYRLEED